MEDRIFEDRDCRKLKTFILYLPDKTDLSNECFIYDIRFRKILKKKYPGFITVNWKSFIINFTGWCTDNFTDLKCGRKHWDYRK